MCACLSVEALMRIAIVVAWLSLWALPAGAQQVQMVEVTSDQKAMIETEVVYPSMLDPSLLNPVMTPYTQLAIHATEDGTSGSFHLGVRRNGGSYGLTLSAPLAGKTATFFDRTGLRNQASVGVDFTGLILGEDPKYVDTSGLGLANATATVQGMSTAAQILNAINTDKFRIPNTLFLTLNGEYGQRTFEFLDPATLGERSEKRDSHSLTASLGYRFGMRDSRSTGYLLSASFTNKRAFSANDEVTVCQNDPSGVAGSTRCQDAPVGSPTGGTTQQLRLESRFRVLNSNIGLNPAYVYTKKTQVHRWESSTYVLFDTGDGSGDNNTSKFSAGATVGWESQDKDGRDRGLFVVVFVGPIFRLNDPFNN
jgi:hypothetical protein